MLDYVRQRYDIVRAALHDCERRDVPVHDVLVHPPTTLVRYLTADVLHDGNCGGVVDLSNATNMQAQRQFPEP